MRFGGEVEHPVAVPHGAQHGLVLTNIAMDEADMLMIEQPRKVLHVARIGQLIEHDDMPIGLHTAHIVYEVATYKSRAAGHQKPLCARHARCPLVFPHHSPLWSRAL